MKRSKLIDFYLYLRNNKCMTKDASTDSHMYRMIDNFICSTKKRKINGSNKKNESI